MRFADIEGYHNIKQRFIKLTDWERLPHCNLLYGDECSPTFSLVLALVKYIFCTAPADYDSCGSCMACKKVRNLSHPDLYFVVPFFSNPSNDGGKHNQFIEFILKNKNPTIKDWCGFLSIKGKVMNIVKEDAHDLASWITMKPIDAKYKVCIIWLPECMTISAANSFLKILEEPPTNSIFFLLSQGKDGILPTILSRTQQVYITPSPLFNRKSLSLKPSERIEADGDNFSKLRAWTRSCYKKDFAEICSMAENFQKTNLEEQKSFLSYCARMLQYVCMIQRGLSSNIEVGGDELNFLESLSRSIESSPALLDISALLKLIDKSIYALERNANSKLLFLNLSLELSW